VSSKSLTIVKDIANRMHISRLNITKMYDDIALLVISLYQVRIKKFFFYLSSFLHRRENGRIDALYFNNAFALLRERNLRLLLKPDKNEVINMRNVLKYSSST